MPITCGITITIRDTCPISRKRFQRYIALKIAERGVVTSQIKVMRVASMQLNKIIKVKRHKETFLEQIKDKKD